jgi:hypothetical protein
LRAGFLPAGFLVALRGRAAATFLALALTLFAFFGLSVVLAAASLIALAAAETTSFVTSTLALAASVKISGADLAASTVALAASAAASSVELGTPSPSSIVASHVAIAPQASHPDWHRVNPRRKKTCAGFEVAAISIRLNAAR